ncbi:MAG: right-handed parallel beta-helix repeat-containing protein, partial [Clostridia bacterium]|nr:right-handed parallel beta-helix repeat-containing protein [Clostridia bacterium]
SSYGGGFYVYENSTFTMNGCTLSSNEATNGGGVYVVSSGSKFKMTDSEISGNKSSCGGGVYLASGTEAEIHGGSIRNNIADGSNGGAIYVYQATLNVDGTEISGCSASTCGGIYIQNTDPNAVTANISNVTITGCSNLITDYGSAIYAYGNLTVNLTNGEITGNKKGTATYWAGVEFTISGAPHICDNEDGDLLVSYATYKIENLEEGAKIGVTGTPPTPNGVFTSGGAITDDNIKCFYSNDEKCIEVINGEASVSADNHAYAEPVWSWAEDCTSADATFTCGNCQHAETVTASGEDIASDVITPATCTSTGETAYTATVEFNGDSKTDTKNQEVAALPHDYADSTKYNSDGAQHWKICKDCTAEDTDHKENCSGGTATCAVKAVCSTCGKAYGDLDANNHAWGEWAVSKAATCTEKGEQARICSRDDSHKETSEINAKGHSYG